MELDDDIFNSLVKYTKALSVALGYRDLSTQLHSERVQELSASIGEYCGLNRKELNTLVMAASFHDVGKIGISDNILLKPAKLDEAEWLKMKEHSEIGEEIMLSTELEGAPQVAR
uniref:HD-GYP domain-containing protein n=1 Tax=Methylophaga lonarensis TaxID=999151 RepID=UPI003D29DE16